MPDLTANTHTELFLKAIAEGSTTPEGLVPENHIELWLQQIMEMGGVSGNYVRYTEQELSAAEEAQARDNIGAAGMEDLAPAYDSTIPYKVGNLLTYLGKMYEVTGDDGADPPVGTLPTDTDYFTERPVSEIIEMIKNGSIVVGHSDVADNLTPYSEDSGTTQENPFISQGTGTDNNSVIVTTGTIARQLEKQGNTAVKNQLCPELASDKGWRNYNFTTTFTFENGVVTLNATGSGDITNYALRMTAGHKYLFRFKIKPTNLSVFIRIPSGLAQQVSVTADQWNDIKLVITADISGIALLQANNGSQITDYYVHDLTQWGFSSSIITDLTSHPEHFSWYYNGSLAYDAGSLANCNGRYLECGQWRNLFDQVTELGYINTDGEEKSATTELRSKNYILVVPNKPIYIKAPNGLGLRFYDKNKNFVSAMQNINSTYVTVPANAIWLRFNLNITYGTTYHNDISVEEYYTPEQGGEGYGEMHDYIAPVRIDTGNETLLAFDKKLPSGVIERNSGEVDLGTLTWTYDSSNLVYYSNRLENELALSTKQIICSKYETDKTATSSALMKDKSITAFSDRFYVKDSSQQDTNITGTVQFLLAESAKTTEQGTPFSEYAPINDYSYMAWFDTDGNLVSIPQGCKLFYPVDYKGFLDDGVMYTNGDFTSLAKLEDIDDTALNARGYYKMQVLLSPLTDAAGLTYDIEEAMKIGNLVSLTIRATNLGESSISSGDPLFTLASDLIPAGTIKAYANVAGSVVSCTISNLGSVSVDAAIAQNETVAIILTYAV